MAFHNGWLPVFIRDFQVTEFRSMFLVTTGITSLSRSHRQVCDELMAQELTMVLLVV
jgi:hypothetical protein